MLNAALRNDGRHARSGQAVNRLTFVAAETPTPSPMPSRRGQDRIGGVVDGLVLMMSPSIPFVALATLSIFSSIATPACEHASGSNEYAGCRETRAVK